MYPQNGKCTPWAGGVQQGSKMDVGKHSPQRSLVINPLNSYMHNQECALRKNITCDTLLKRLGLPFLISGKRKAFSLSRRILPRILGQYSLHTTYHIPSRNNYSNNLNTKAVYKISSKKKCNHEFMVDLLNENIYNLKINYDS